jgi:hypothetical protein
VAVLVRKIQCFTLEVWIQDSNPDTQTPVGVGRSTGMAPPIGAPKSLWIHEEFQQAQNHQDKRVEEKKGA